MGPAVLALGLVEDEVDACDVLADRPHRRVEVVVDGIHHADRDIRIIVDVDRDNDVAVVVVADRQGAVGQPAGDGVERRVEGAEQGAGTEVRFATLIEAGHRVVIGLEMTVDRNVGVDGNAVRFRSPIDRDAVHQVMVEGTDDVGNRMSRLERAEDGRTNHRFHRGHLDHQRTIARTEHVVSKANPSSRVGLSTESADRVRVEDVAVDDHHCDRVARQRLGQATHWVDAWGAELLGRRGAGVVELVDIIAVHLHEVAPTVIETGRQP